MVSATGFHPVFGGVNTYSHVSGKNPIKRNVAQGLNQNSFRRIKELMLELNGVAAGAAALAQHSRVAHATDMGGKRTIEVIDDVNRVTAAADVTEIATDILAYPLQPTTYPANGDLNPRNLGGG